MKRLPLLIPFGTLDSKNHETVDEGKGRFVIASPFDHSRKQNKILVLKDEPELLRAGNYSSLKQRLIIMNLKANFQANLIKSYKIMSAFLVSVYCNFSHVSHLALLLVFP